MHPTEFLLEVLQQFVDYSSRLVPIIVGIGHQSDSVQQIRQINVVIFFIRKALERNILAGPEIVSYDLEDYLENRNMGSL